ncbi:hypothetical protein ACRAWD_23060 [Caulobacter segnis]
MLQFTPVGGLALAEADRGMADVELDGKRIIEGGRLFGGSRLIKTPDGLLNQGQVVRLGAGTRHRLKLSGEGLGRRAAAPAPGLDPGSAASAAGRRGGGGQSRAGRRRLRPCRGHGGRGSPLCWPCPTVRTR